MRQKNCNQYCFSIHILLMTNLNSFGQKKGTQAVNTRQATADIICGGKGSSHKGGTYKNSKTNNHGSTKVNNSNQIKAFDQSRQRFIPQLLISLFAVNFFNILNTKFSN